MWYRRADADMDAEVQLQLQTGVDRWGSERGTDTAVTSPAREPCVTSAQGQSRAVAGTPLSLPHTVLQHVWEGPPRVRTTL